MAAAHTDKREEDELELIGNCYVYISDKYIRMEFRKNTQNLLKIIFLCCILYTFGFII